VLLKERLDVVFLISAVLVCAGVLWMLKDKGAR
jgi:drug/metabolite transporter (DMT)-like permease